MVTYKVHPCHGYLYTYPLPWLPVWYQQPCRAVFLSQSQIELPRRAGPGEQTVQRGRRPGSPMFSLYTASPLQQPIYTMATASPLQQPIYTMATVSPLQQPIYTMATASPLQQPIYTMACLDYSHWTCAVSDLVCDTCNQGNCKQCFKFGNWVSKAIYHMFDFTHVIFPGCATDQMYYWIWFESYKKNSD